MKKKRYTDEQIGFVLRQAETGTLIGEVCRKTGAARVRMRWSHRLWETR